MSLQLLSGSSFQNLIVVIGRDGQDAMDLVHLDDIQDTTWKDLEGPCKFCNKLQGPVLVVQLLDYPHMWCIVYICSCDP